MKLFIVLSVLCALAICQQTQGVNFDREIAPGVTITQQDWYFNQVLDHFHPQKQQTFWTQRFQTFSQYWNPVKGAIFISIGGEAQMHGISAGRGWLVALAQKYSALVISVEHRFYGQSQPFPQTDKTNSFDTQNLKYLTHDQALADIAYFLSFVKQDNFAHTDDGKVNNFFTSEQNAIITVGGSYPGALSAWFRYKYPHLTVGALASSAVVNAIKDFWKYDDQIYVSCEKSQNQCSQNIQSFIKGIDAEIQNVQTHDQLLKDFKCDPTMTNSEFSFYIPDSIASFVQYGQRTTLCQIFNTADYATQKANLIAYWTKNGFPDSSTYLQATLNSPVYDSTGRQNARQWLYQYCSYFGWLQTPSKIQDHIMRGPSNTIAFFQNQCVTAFGSTYLPKASEVNALYGGTSLLTTNTIYTNGSEDPWQWASLRESVNGNIALISECNDCAHGVELGYPSQNDPQEVTNTRNTITQNFSKWIDQFNSQFNFVQSKIKKTTQ